MRGVRGVGWRIVDIDAQWTHECEWYGLRLWLEK
jgi:hypothetical protein